MWMVDTGVLWRALFLLIVCHSSLLGASSPRILVEIPSDTTLTLFDCRIVPLGDQEADGFDDFLLYDCRDDGVHPNVFRAYYFRGGESPDTVPVMYFDSVNGRIDNVGDINGDGFDDFTIPGRSPHGWKLGLYLGGPLMDTVRNLWFGLDTLYGIGYTVRGKDLNGNGNDDIITWSNFQNSVLLFELGTDGDSVPDLVLTPPNLPYDGYSFGDGIISGDFNGDGFNDLGVNLRRRPDQSISGSVFLYWGGPGFDTIPDLIIEPEEPFSPGKVYFGWVLEVLGDVNGDGYTDIFVGSGAAYEDTISFVYFGGPQIDGAPDLTLVEPAIKARKAGNVFDNGFRASSAVVPPQVRVWAMYGCTREETAWIQSLTFTSMFEICLATSRISAWIVRDWAMSTATVLMILPSRARCP